MIKGVGEDVLHLLDHKVQGSGQEVGTLPNDSLSGQEQIKDYLKQMKDFIEDDEARFLGIYGMGGIGKTTLLKIINDGLVGINARRRFDHVIFITMSQVVDVEKMKRDIQEQIRGNLSSLRKSRFLLLLDDVWNEVDLSELKIPIPSSQNRCKVIMTDRSKSYRRVKNANQEGTKSFELSTLTETEPWIFFQKKVGKN